MPESLTYIVPGLRQPPVFSADKAKIPDGQQVIGVVVEGQARAYVTDAMSTPRTHVINDLVKEIPVTITYCDKTDCARVLTRSGSRNLPLRIGVGGWADKRMQLHIDGDVVAQDSRELPFDDYPFEKTTWKKWKDAHPRTQVYVGAAVVPVPMPARRMPPGATTRQGIRFPLISQIAQNRFDS